MKNKNVLLYKPIERGEKMLLNELKTVKIINLDHQGRGIGRIEDKIIFIPNTLIGEVIEAKITNIKKNYMEGEISVLLETVPIRLEPKCPYFFSCGGCDIMHMPYDQQLLYKENKVKEIIKKFANIEDAIVKPIIGASNPYNYRNKITFQVKNQVGFYKKKSNDIIDVDYCMISDVTINNFIAKIKKEINLNNVRQIIIRSSKNTSDNMVIFITDGLIDETKIVEVLGEDVTSIIEKSSDNYWVISGENYIVEQMGEFKFVISPDSFFQVNTDQAVKLYDQVLDYAELRGDENVLDLYCGTGTIGLYLSPYCKEVLGIEVNDYAVKDALKNKEINKINNIDFKCGDVGRIINNLEFIPDVIVVDPPRTGLDKNTIDNLLKLNSKKIIYVSCDPITLARDLKFLQEKYDIKEITPVDMFSNTYHVECVVKLCRKIYMK